MDQIEALLRALDDGDWHLIVNLASQLRWTRSLMIQLIEILSEHGLVQYRRLSGSVRLDPDLLSLRRET